MEHQALHTFHRQIGHGGTPAEPLDGRANVGAAERRAAAYILPPVANLTSGPSGLTYHPGTGFLESEAGRFLICDYRGGAANSGIWSFKVEPSGAGMKMTDSRQINWGAAVTDVEYSWDGKLDGDAISSAAGPRTRTAGCIRSRPRNRGVPRKPSRRRN